MPPRIPRLVLAFAVLAPCAALVPCAAIASDAPAPPAASPEPPADWHSLWDFADPAASERRFREALAKAEAAGDRPRAVVLRTQVARAEGLLGRFDAAHATLDVAEKGAGPEEKGLWAWIALERGRVFRSSKKPDLAKRSIEKALAFAELAKDEDAAVDAVHMLALLATGDEALRLNMKAIAMAEAATTPRAKGWLGSLYNNTGWTWFEKGDYEKALDLQKKNWEWHEGRKMTSEARIGKWAYARTLRALHRLDEAMRLQEELRAACEADKSEDGYVFEEIAEILHEQGKAADAKPWFAKAYAALAKDADFARDEAKRLARLRELGGVAGAGADAKPDGK